MPNRTGISPSEEFTKLVDWFRRESLILPLLLFALVIPLGFIGFNLRPPQKATFNARFDTGTILDIQEIEDHCRGLSVNEIGGQARGIVLAKHFGRPIELRLPMESKEFETLAKDLGSACQQCTFVEVEENSLLELDFQNPPYVSINAPGADDLTFTSSVVPTDTVLVDAKEVTAGNSQGPILQMTLTGESQMSMRVGGNIREYSLGSGGMRTISLRPYTQTNEVEGVAQLLQTGNEPENGFHADVCAKQIQVEDTPEGVLALGPDVNKLGWGERLQLNFDRSVPVDLRNEIVKLNARDCQNAGVPRPPVLSSSCAVL